MENINIHKNLWINLFWKIQLAFVRTAEQSLHLNMGKFQKLFLGIWIRLRKKFWNIKDFTDFELILKEINKISENEDFVEKIFVVGGLGKRIDMTLSNLFIMEKYKNLVFLQENEEIFYAEKSFILKNKKEYEFSIIPISEKVEKLTLKGFKFKTDKIDVKRESSRLVSNVIVENEASVEFENGKLIIILKNNNKNILY